MESQLCVLFLFILCIILTSQLIKGLPKSAVSKLTTVSLVPTEGVSSCWNWVLFMIVARCWGALDMETSDRRWDSNLCVQEG